MPPLPAAPAALAACALALPAHAAWELIKLQGTLMRLSHLPWEAGRGNRSGGVTAVSSSGIKQGWQLWLRVSKPFRARTCEFAFWGDELSSPPSSFPPHL